MTPVDCPTNDTNNGVVVHTWFNDLTMNWVAVKVVSVEQHLTNRKVQESLLILEAPPALIHSPYTIPITYVHLTHYTR